MKLLEETFLGKNTYEYELEDGKKIWIYPEKEEIFIDRMGTIRKVYFSLVNEKEEKTGLEGKFALQKDEVIFLNIVFEDETDYAEFYEPGNKIPVKEYVRLGDKLYLKDENEFFEAKRNDESKIGLDSEVTILGKDEKFKYPKSKEKIEKYRKEICDAYDLFFEKWKNNN